MTLIIFIIILGVLIFVHELGHFLAAKAAHVKTEEFGFGYPPRALTLGKKWGTLFTLNWIPFGGFVKIAGENYEEDSAEPVSNSLRSNDASHTSLQESSPARQKLFTQASKKWQAAILAAGVTFNIIFAWLLFSLGFMIGLPTPVENDYGAAVRDPQLTIVSVLPDSPAQEAGLKSGDKIISLSNGAALTEPSLENVSDFINSSPGQIQMEILRGKENLTFEVTPQTNTADNASDSPGPARKMVGIEMDMVGTLSLPLHQALYEGAKVTWRLMDLTVRGISDLIGRAFVGQADISQVSGPVGIVGLVGDASRLGFAYLLTFSALISINLAIINLVPFPALDGGRIIFVIIEAITRRRINTKVANILNTAGFALLILLMLFITYRDIVKLF